MEQEQILEALYAQLGVAEAIGVAVGAAGEDPARRLAGLGEAVAEVAQRVVGEVKEEGGWAFSEARCGIMLQDASGEVVPGTLVIGHAVLRKGEQEVRCQLTASRREGAGVLWPRDQEVPVRNERGESLGMADRHALAGWGERAAAALCDQLLGEELEESVVAWRRAALVVRAEGQLARAAQEVCTADAVLAAAVVEGLAGEGDAQAATAAVLEQGWQGSSGELAGAVARLAEREDGAGEKDCAGEEDCAEQVWRGGAARHGEGESRTSRARTP